MDDQKKTRFIILAVALSLFGCGLFGYMWYTEHQAESTDSDIATVEHAGKAATRMIGADESSPDSVNATSGTTGAEGGKPADLTASNTGAPMVEPAPGDTTALKPEAKPAVAPVAIVAAKPEAKPAVAPVAIVAAKPEAKPAVAPVAIVAAKPAAAPVAIVAAKPEAKPAVAPAATVAVKPAAKPATIPAATVAAKPAATAVAPPPASTALKPPATVPVAKPPENPLIAGLPSLVPATPSAAPPVAPPVVEQPPNPNAVGVEKLKKRFPAIKREELVAEAKQAAGRQDPMLPYLGGNPYPFFSKPKDEPAATETAKVPPPPPPTTTETAKTPKFGGPPKGLVPPPPPSDPSLASLPGGLPINELPVAPDKPTVADKLKLAAVIGNRVILHVPHSVRQQNKWPATITLAPGEQFESLSVVSVDGDSVTLDEDGERTVKTLASIK